MKKLETKTLTVQEIFNLVSSYIDIDITLKTRQDDYVYARAVYFKLCHEEKHTLQSAAKLVNKDHATAVHGRKVFLDLFSQLRFRRFKDLYLNCKLEMDALKDDNLNLTDFLLRFKEDIKIMSLEKYVKFKVTVLKGINEHNEAREQEDNYIRAKASGYDPYFFNPSPTDKVG